MARPSLTLVMPTIGWEDPFASCLSAALAGLEPQDEALVVFDGSPPQLPDWLADRLAGSRARLLNTGQRSGPAAARNLAAREAQGAILLFVDADVQVHPEAIPRIRDQFAADPELMAVFGSYDDAPVAPGLVSRFRNLLHHHTHTSHPGPATTFWAGLGAVRRDAFLAQGGFDATTYRRPSIEDIEFGLRLCDSGGRLLLDPSILGTHHKRWTLASMLATDIRQRAIPWSRLLLSRRQLPATLNLDPAARLSAAASLLLPVSLLAATHPDLRLGSLLLAATALALLLGLNRTFHALLLRRLGVAGAAVGVGLHALYLGYSSLTLALLTAWTLGRRPLRLPPWLRQRARLRRALVIAGLSLLALLALAATAKGLVLGWHLSDTDLYERLDEWRLFRDGVYPSGGLATAAQRALPHFRTSVYLPWALPLFGLLFAPGGAAQGTVLIQALSLLSLGLLAWIGWRSLVPWGRAAAWLGALSPLAIAANSNTLAQGQFSIVCMGLIALQWLLLLCHRPLPAGLCWALAMIKPQIAAPFALPLLGAGRRRGLALGLALLGLLSGAALLHTHTDPLRYAASWLAVLPAFIGAGNRNVSAGLMTLWSHPTRQALLIAGTLLGVAGLLALLTTVMRRRHYRLSTGDATGPSAGIAPSEPWQRDPLAVAALMAVLAAVGTYHRNVDNILLAPALLAAWRQALRRPCLADLSLALLTGASLWCPQRLLDAIPGSSLAQSLIWILLGLRLLGGLLRQRSSRIRAATLSPD